MTRCDHMAAGACSLGLFGGRPSEGVCSRCPKYEGPARGAGDVIHSALDAIGIVKVMEFVFDGNCGCERRRAALNAMMPRKEGDS